MRGGKLQLETFFGTCGKKWKSEKVATNGINYLEASRTVRVAENWFRKASKTNQDQGDLMLWKVRSWLKWLNSHQEQRLVHSHLHKLSLMNRIYQDVPRELINDQSQRHVNICKQLMTNSQYGRFWHGILSGNGKCIYFRILIREICGFVSVRLTNMSNKSGLNRRACCVLGEISRSGCGVVAKWASSRPSRCECWPLCTKTTASIISYELPLSGIGQSKMRAPRAWQYPSSYCQSDQP